MLIYKRRLKRRRSLGSASSPRNAGELSKLTIGSLLNPVLYQGDRVGQAGELASLFEGEAPPCFRAQTKGNTAMSRRDKDDARRSIESCGTVGRREGVGEARSWRHSMSGKGRLWAWVYCATLTDLFGVKSRGQRLLRELITRLAVSVPPACQSVRAAYPKYKTESGGREEPSRFYEFTTAQCVRDFYGPLSRCTAVVKPTAVRVGEDGISAGG
eukprot:596367-Hanusia_phi.AAC.2